MELSAPVLLSIAGSEHLEFGRESGGGWPRAGKAQRKAFPVSLSSDGMLSPATP